MIEKINYLIKNIDNCPSILEKIYIWDSILVELWFHCEYGTIKITKNVQVNTFSVLESERIFSKIIKL